MILAETIKKILKRLKEEKLLDEEIILRAKVLSAEEAIGNPENYDFPLLKGKEKIIEADFLGHKGHAFTDMYGGFHGLLKEVFEMKSSNNYRRALQVATINALVNYWGLVKDTVHCKDIQPHICAQKSVESIKKKYSNIKKIAFVGYQPALIDIFSKEYSLKILDLDKDNIGQLRYGITILDGNKDLKDAIESSELILATGSTLVNGTIDNILEIKGKEKVIFYGVTIAGVASLLNLKRMCFST